MDINKFTEKAALALHTAQNAAARRKHQAIDCEHLLLALLAQEDGLIPRLFTRAGVSLQRAKSELEKNLLKRPAVSGSVSPYITQRLNQLIIQAEEEAQFLKDEYISVEHSMAMFMTRNAKSFRFRLNATLHAGHDGCAGKARHRPQPQRKHKLKNTGVI